MFPKGGVRPARLHAIVERPVENRSLSVLRLEFEIFEEIPTGVLRSTGKIACRDIVVGSSLDLSVDPRGQMWMAALSLPCNRVNHVEEWPPLAWGKRHKRPWVKITFGDVNSRDQRASFDHVVKFDPTGYELNEYDYDLDDQWVSVGVIASRIGISAPTVRRLVKKHLPEFGERLERRTDGNHRRVNWTLLSNLWNESF